MDFKQTLNFLFNQLPIFQNQGKSAFNKDLGKTIALCKAIGNPQNSLNFIHIAGTNGKGSVCHMLASVLKQSGLKTGLYTSPHLLDFRERIRINGEYISKAFVVEFIESIKHEIETIKPSFFELTFAMALKYFEFQKTDIVVLETGMGGRLDSTNIVTPILSIITNIGLDHQMYLGNSIKAIAKEKAGIIKHQIPALLTDEQPEVIEIFKQTCTLNHSEGYFTSKKVTLSEDSPIQIQLTKSSSVSVNSPFVAKYQRENISTVAAAFSILRNKLNLNENDLKLGIEQVQLNFKLIGRWQLLSKNPRVIIDVGHNKDGITQILSQLKLEKYNALKIVFGMVNDKSTETIKLLPKQADYYLCEANIPRAMPIKQLDGLIRQNGLNIKSNSKSVKSAYFDALKNAKSDDLILIIGSLFVVAEVLECIEN